MSRKRVQLYHGANKVLDVPADKVKEGPTGLIYVINNEKNYTDIILPSGNVLRVSEEKKAKEG